MFKIQSDAMKLIDPIQTTPFFWIDLLIRLHCINNIICFFFPLSLSLVLSIITHPLLYVESDWICYYKNSLHAARGDGWMNISGGDYRNGEFCGENVGI